MKKKHLLKLLKTIQIYFWYLFLLLIWENEFAIKPLKESNRRSLTVTSLLSWIGLCILWLYVQKYQKAQPAVALVLNISDDGATRQTGGVILNSGPLGDIAKKGHNLVTKTDIRVQK